MGNLIEFNIIIFILIIIFVFLLGITFYHLIIKFINKFRLKIRFKKGRTGEVKAKEFLLKKGFKILAEQAVLKSQIFIDNEPNDYEIRTDYIVKKNGKTSIVEVKTGDKAIDPLNTGTRRQLYEYLNIFNADFIYLLDAKNFILKKIYFLSKKTKSNFFVLFILMFLILSVILLIVIEIYN